MPVAHVRGVVVEGRARLVPQIVTYYGIASLVAALAAYVIASAKRRNYEAWAFWCFLLPPLVIALLFMPRLGPGERYRPLTDDDDDVFRDLGRDD